MSSGSKPKAAIVPLRWAVGDPCVVVRDKTYRGVVESIGEGCASVKIGEDRRIFCGLDELDLVPLSEVPKDEPTAATMAAEIVEVPAMGPRELGDAARAGQGGARRRAHKKKPTKPTAVHRTLSLFTRKTDLEVDGGGARDLSEPAPSPRRRRSKRLVWHGDFGRWWTRRGKKEHHLIERREAGYRVSVKGRSIGTFPGRSIGTFPDLFAAVRACEGI